MPSGGWRNGGRPKGSTSRKPTKTGILQVRLTEEEKQAIGWRAEKKGMTISEYVRNALLKG